jgi:hypothetical protein
MFGKHGTVWQVGLAVIGLVIVGIVLFGPRGKATTLVTSPTADVASNNAQAAQAAVQQPAAQQQSTDQPAGGQAASAPSDGASAAGSGSGSAALPAAATSAAAKAGARAGAATLPALSAVPGVSTVGRTLFLDNFASDPLGTGLPTGWLLADPTSGLNGLPILGSLLGGLTSSTPVPSIVNDGVHVLSRPAGSWSHLSAGPMTVDSSATAGVKMMGQGSGFVGVAGRFQDANNTVMCGLSGGTTLQLLQIVNGHQQLLASSPVTAAMNVFHTIRMDMQGGQMSCSLDGGSVLHATGSWTSPGRLGLVALGDVTSEFNSVMATALP